MKANLTIYEQTNFIESRNNWKKLKEEWLLKFNTREVSKKRVKKEILKNSLK